MDITLFRLFCVFALAIITSACVQEPTDSAACPDGDFPVVTLSSNSPVTVDDAQIAFTATLDRVSDQDITLRFTTMDKTATAGEDYTFATNPALRTITAGALSKNINVTLGPTLDVNGSESFDMQLEVTTCNATVSGTGSLTARINDTGLLAYDGFTRTDGLLNIDAELEVSPAGASAVSWGNDTSAFTIISNALQATSAWQRITFDVGDSSLAAKPAAKVIEMPFHIVRSSVSAEEQRIEIINRSSSGADEWRGRFSVSSAQNRYTLRMQRRQTGVADVVGTSLDITDLLIANNIDPALEGQATLMLIDDGYIQVLSIKELYDADDHNTYVDTQEVAFQNTGDVNYNAAVTVAGIRSGALPTDGGSFVESYLVTTKGWLPKQKRYIGHWVAALDGDAEIKRLEESKPAGKYLWEPDVYQQTNVRGLHIRIKWNQIETGIKSYDNTALEYELQRLRDHYADTGEFYRVIFFIEDKTWKVNEHALPDDMVTAGYDVQHTATGVNGYMSKRWLDVTSTSQGPAERFSLLMEWLAAQYADDPHVEGFAMNESSLGLKTQADRNAAGYDSLAYMQYYKKLLRRVHDAFKGKLSFFWYMNFMNDNQDGLTGSKDSKALSNTDNLSYYIQNHPAYTGGPGAGFSDLVDMRTTIKQGNPDILQYHNKAEPIHKQVFYGYYLHSGVQDMFSACQKDSYIDKPDGSATPLATLESQFQIAAGGTAGGYDHYGYGEKQFSLKYLFWTRSNIGAPQRPYSEAQAVMAAHPTIDR